MRTLVLGGDGYLGWPTALYLSALGHELLEPTITWRETVRSRRS